MYDIRIRVMAAAGVPSCGFRPSCMPLDDSTNNAHYSYRYIDHINYHKPKGNYFDALMISIANSVSRLASTTLVITSFPSTIQAYNSLNSRV